MELANRPYLAVLDGQSPNTWKPWDSLPLKELYAEFEKKRLNISTVDPKLRGRRLQLLFQPPEVLAGWKDSDWVRVVGVVVDATNFTGDSALKLKQNFRSLCIGIRDAKSSWAKIFEFFTIIVVLPSESDAQHDEFWNELKLEARDNLRIKVLPQTVDDDASFVFALRSVNEQLIDAIKEAFAVGKH